MNNSVIFGTKNWIFSIFLMFCLNSLIAQESNKVNSKSNFWKNVSFGGGIGLSFGNNITNVALSPTAIYKFNDHVASGVSLLGNYTSSRDNFSAFIYGGSIMALVNPIQELQTSLELELNRVNFDDKILDETRNYWYPALFIGAGYNIGNFGAVGMRYDLLYDESKSVYGTALLPFVRVFF